MMTVFHGSFFSRLIPWQPIKSDRIDAMARKKASWLPQIGVVATYIGRAGKLARGGYNVRVVAETCADRMLVEAIGRSGLPVRFTVKRENLAPLQPGLFD
jgi:hypothetical protein